MKTSYRVLGLVGLKWREANRRSTVEPGATEADSRSGEETYNHVNDGADCSHLGGSGVICSCEVLPVVAVCGDERQPGVLATQSHTNHFSRGRRRDPLNHDFGPPTLSGALKTVSFPPSFTAPLATWPDWPTGV